MAMSIEDVWQSMYDNFLMTTEAGSKIRFRVSYPLFKDLLADMAEKSGCDLPWLQNYDSFSFMGIKVVFDPSLPNDTYELCVDHGDGWCAGDPMVFLVK